MYQIYARGKCAREHAEQTERMLAWCAVLYGNDADVVVWRAARLMRAVQQR